MEEKKLYDLKQSIRFAGVGKIDQQINAMIAANYQSTDITLEPTRIRGHQADIVLHFNRHENNHYLNAFTMKLQPRVEIVHETIGKLNTRDLDIRMGEVDWKLFPHEDKLAKMTEPEILAIQKSLALRDELVALSSHGVKELLPIQEKLAVKHWKDTPWADTWQDFNLAVTRHTKPAVTQTFPTQYNEHYSIYDAVELLAKGSVYKQIIPFESKRQDTAFPAVGNENDIKGERDMRPFKAWVVIDFEKKRDDNQYWKSFLHKEYYQDAAAPKPKFNLGAKLDEFDLIENRNSAAKQKRMDMMEAGLPALFHYTKDGKDHEVYVSANPRFNSVTFRDRDGHILPHEQIPRYDLSKVQAMQTHMEKIGDDLKGRVNERLQIGSGSPAQGAAREVQGQINQLNVNAADRTNGVAPGKPPQHAISR